MDDSLRGEAIRALLAMQAGKLNLIEGCRTVARALVRMDSTRSTSEAAKTILGIESETDTFPLGAVRDHWDPASLARLDADLSEYVDTIRESLLAACGELAAELRQESGERDEV